MADLTVEKGASGFQVSVCSGLGCGVTQVWVHASDSVICTRSTKSRI